MRSKLINILRNIKSKISYTDINDNNRQKWLQKTLAALPEGLRILDAGAGELRNKIHCGHLMYVSQDFCQYSGTGNGTGLQTGKWDTKKIDIVCDIVNIPEPDNSFDIILCSEVLEHIPEPQNALKEFSRLLKPGGKLILTAPFASLVHFAPYYYCSGFSKYWYEYHLPKNSFRITELTANGDWFNYCNQEMVRLRSMAKKQKDPFYFFALIIAFFGNLYFKISKAKKDDELACFGFHCIAEKIN